MANQTIEELKDFVNEQMPSNSELLVLPFRTFFFRILNFLAEVPEGSSVNQFMYSVFGTQDVNLINLQQSLGADFTGDNLIAYLNYLPNKLGIKNFNTLTSLQQAVLSDGETLRILKFSEDGPTKLYVRDIVNDAWVPVGGLTPEDSALIFGSLDDLYSKHNLQETAISNKLNKPTTNNNNTYVILGDGTTASLASIDTNIFKNDGTTTGDRVLTLGGVFTVNINGKTWTFSGLSDKSADASFNLMLAINAAGQIAKSNGKNLLKGMPSLLSEAEKTAWKTEMNGGWTTNTMSVGLVLPMVISKLRNENSWVVLKGTNLNLNPANFSLKLLDVNNNEITTVPNSQIQLSTGGLELTFYYNFSQLSQSKVKIQLNNGISIYTVPFEISLINSQLSQIDLTQNTWNVATYNGIQNKNDSFSTTSVNYVPDADVKPLAADAVVVWSALSSVALDFSRDFQINFSFIHGGGGSPATGGYQITGFGISSEQTVQLGKGIDYGYTWHNNSVLSIPNGGSIEGIQQCWIVKQGSNLTLIITNGTNYYIKTFSVPLIGLYRFKAFFNNYVNGSAGYSHKILSAEYLD